MSMSFAKLLSVLTGLSLVTGALPSTDTPPARSESSLPMCVVAERWAASQATVPGDQFSFRFLSPAFQRAAYRRLTVEQKIALWRAHFAAVSEGAVAGSELKRFIADVDGALPALLAQDTIGEIRNRGVLDSLQRFAIAKWGKPFAKLLFVQLGESSPNSVFTSLPEAEPSFLRGPSQPAETGLTSCGCNQGGIEWCGSPTGPAESCKSDGCTVTSSGCGGLWRYPCDGNCKGLDT